MTDLNANIEGDQVRNQAIRRDLVLLDLRRQTKTVEQAEDQRGHFGVGLETEPALECAQVVERLVHHREANDGVDDVRADADLCKYAKQQRDRVSHRKQRDVEAHVFQAVEEEDYSEQEQQVIVARHHVLGAHIDERQQHDSGAFLDETLVTFSDGMRHRFGHAEEKCRQKQKQQ